MTVSNPANVPDDGRYITWLSCRRRRPLSKCQGHDMVLLVYIREQYHLSFKSYVVRADAKTARYRIIC